MSIKENIKNKFNLFVEKQFQNEKNKSIDFSFLANLEEDKINIDDSSQTKDLKEQLKDIDKNSYKSLKDYFYILNNFYKKLYIIEAKDYSTGHILRKKIRGSSKKEASENAKELFDLKYEPEIVKTIEVNKKKTFDKFIVNPTFFLTSKIDKAELGVFLEEYASLMQDGLTKKDAITILLKIVKDKGLKDFLYEFRDTSYSMSNLMKISGKFDQYTYTLIESAEASGGSSQFYEGLAKLGQDYIFEADFVRGFKKSLRYPIGMLILLALIVIISLIKVVPTLSTVFAGIVGKDKVPELMKSLMSVSDNLFLYIGYLLASIVFIVIIKNILLSNDILLMKWELFKLKIPIIGNIIQKREENKIMSIFIQTINSQLSPIKKLQILKDSTTSKLYDKVYLYLISLYPKNQNMVKVFEIAQKDFGNKIFGETFIIMIKLAQESSTTEKRFNKYKSFLGKNIKRLQETMDIVKTTTTSVIIVFAISLVGFILYMITSVTFSMMG